MRRAGTAGGLALVAAGALALAAGNGSTAASSCTQAGDQLTVALEGRERAELRVGPAREILLDRSPCASATLNATQAITVQGGGGAQHLTLDGRGGSFEATAVEAALGKGREDRVSVIGLREPEHHHIDADSIELDPEVGSELALIGVERLTIKSGHGDDELHAQEWERRLALRGGRGDDDLHGGKGRDLLHGGPGDDRCEGGAGRDALVSCMPRFDGASTPLDAELRKRMTGRSWHRGCPVGLDRLRLLRLPHWTMKDRDVHNGKLVVHRDSDEKVLRAMRGVLHARFPIRRMELIDRYGGDDHRSMNANNTSAFNCRFVAGTSRWSQHAFGRAVDVNPIQNPYVTPSGHVSPPAGRPYANRSRRAPGMLHRGDRAVRAFARVGWKWGGRWPGTKDYQHFSATGR